MLKAESLMALIDDIKVNNYITWPVYSGESPIDAKTMENYVTPFFRTGTIMPMPILNLGLDISSVQIEHNYSLNNYRIVVEGKVTKLKGDMK